MIPPSVPDGDAGGSHQGVGHSINELPRGARRVVRDIWPSDVAGIVIVHEQYQLPERWWHPATRAIGASMILLAIGWPAMLLSYGWMKLGIVFAVADVALASTGWELMTAGRKRWL